MRLWLSIVLVATGCTTSRQVTPWLRTRIERTPVLYAESGGPRDHVFTERLVDGHWTVVSTCCSAALALPGGRAVFHDDFRLVTSTEQGPSVPLDCSFDSLRLAPGGERLVCLASTERSAEAAEALPLRVSTWSVDGALLESRQVALGARMLPGNFFPHFVGFLDGQPLLSAHVAPFSTTPGLAGFCAAWVLDGLEWRPLARLTTSDWPRCHEAAFWRDRLPGNLEPGEAPAPP